MQRSVERLAQEEFDCVIIGGGIYGACLAWEATLRGLSTALIEAEDFGGKTSANSQKIIHGGLRYLQHMDIARIRESVRERTVLLRIAPHLVRPMACLMPTYRGLTQPRWVMGAAGMVYDAFSWDRNQGIRDPQLRIPATRTVNAAECLRLAPDLETEGMTGGIVWQDGQMVNSERLTLAFVISAAAKGATVINYAKVTGLKAEGGKVSGITVEDRLTGRTLAVKARKVCNAAGPWIEELLESGLPNYRKTVRFSKAVNLVTRSLNDVVALGVPSRTPQSTGQRLFFITPWKGLSIVGTEFSAHDEAPDRCSVTREEIERFLHEINAAFPKAGLSMDDVHYVQCGLLPVTDPRLRREFGQVDRHYHLWDHAEQGFANAVTVVGVKYTTARDVAEKLMNQMTGQNSTVSRNAVLRGGDIERLEAFADASVARHPQLPEAAVVRLVSEYGSAYTDVLDEIKEDASLVAGTQDVLRAEVRHAVRREMAQSLTDVVFRRIGIATLTAPSPTTLEDIAAVMAPEFEWDEQERRKQVDAVLAQLAALKGETV